MTLDLNALPDLGLFPYRDERKLIPVPMHSRLEAESAFAKLAKRCAKRLDGASAPTLVWTARGLYRVTHEIDNGDGEKIQRSRNVPCLFGTISGDAPKLAGWTLAARMTTLATGERITRNVPGVEIPDRIRALGASDCEHCKTARNRNDVFVVRNVESGAFVQVGRTCLRDFLGHDPARLLAAWSAFESITDSANSFCSGLWTADTYSTQAVLEIAACAIRLDSWVSRKVSDETGKVSTAGQVQRLLSGRGLTPSEIARYQWERYTGVGAVNDLDVTTATAALAWARGLSGENDYEKNMLASTRHDSTDTRAFGLVCSAIAGYLRTVSRAAELDLKRTANLASVYVGAPKERLRGLSVTIEHMQHIASDFGGCTLYKFRDASGNLLSWFASGPNRPDAKPGDRVSLTGTVKAHKEYKGVRETQLSRCTFEKARETVAA